MRRGLTILTCSWVLWSQISTAAGTEWSPGDSYEKLSECKSKSAKMTELALRSLAGTKFQGMITYGCLSDTVDPRKPRSN